MSDRSIGTGTRWPHAVVAALMLLATACDGGATSHGGQEPGAPLPPAETKPFRACASADDCVYAKNGCCDCVNGGQAIAINRNQVDAFRARFQCDKVPCTMAQGIPGCDSGRVSCVAGQCEYALNSAGK